MILRSGSGNISLVFTLFLFTLTLFSGFKAGFCQENQEIVTEEAEKLPPARQNPILRNFFRQRYPSWRIENDPDNFVEDFVDRQIDHFLVSVQEDLRDLKNSVEVLKKLHHRAVKQKEDPSVQKEITLAFIGALKETEDKADDLRDLISIILVGLERKGDFEETVSLSAQENWFEQELIYIANHVFEAEVRIQDYLFETKNVVDARNLNRESMMSCLFFAEQMAKEVRKRLED